MDKRSAKRFFRSFLKSLAVALSVALLRWILSLGSKVAFSAPHKGILDILRPVNPPRLPDTDFEGAVFIMQVIFASVVLFFLYGDRSSKWWSSLGLSSQVPQQGETTRAFLSAWRKIWWSWAVLYLGLSAGWAVGKFGSVTISTSVYLRFAMWGFGDVVNTFAALGFFQSYSALGRSGGDQNTRNSFAVFSGVALALLLLSLLDQHGGIPFLHYIGSYLLYTFNGLAMFFFFGRLSAISPNHSPLSIAPLYLYASIQFPYSTFEILSGSPVFYRPVFFLLTLCLKAYLFFAVSHMLLGQSGARREALIKNDQNIAVTPQ